jgi:hypothetical protein
MNTIRNCPVTMEDVNIAERIFGTDMLSPKGKSARRKSTPVREDTVKIPEELVANNCEIELCIDIMYVRIYDNNRSNNLVLECNPNQEPHAQ